MWINIFNLGHLASDVFTFALKVSSISFRNMFGADGRKRSVVKTVNQTVTFKKKSF